MRWSSSLSVFSSIGLFLCLSSRPLVLFSICVFFSWSYFLSLLGPLVFVKVLFRSILYSFLSHFSSVGQLLCLICWSSFLSVFSSFGLLLCLTYRLIAVFSVANVLSSSSSLSSLSSLGLLLSLYFRLLVYFYVSLSVSWSSSLSLIWSLPGLANRDSNVWQHLEMLPFSYTLISILYVSLSVSWWPCAWWMPQPCRWTCLQPAQIKVNTR